MYDYDSRWNEYHPTEEDEIIELVDHLKGREPYPCSYCVREMEIRQYGAEGETLVFMFYEEQAREMEML